MNAAFIGFDISNQSHSPDVVNKPQPQQFPHPSINPNHPDDHEFPQSLFPTPPPSHSSEAGETMASRGGPTVLGTDGTDFLHRERVASHYQVSAKNKSRLKFCIFLQYVFFLVMLLKMVPDILDRLDIFILEIEELYVPQPLLWEYLWVLSVFFTFSGITAIRRNKLKSLRIYQIGTLVFGFFPVVFGLIWFAKDVKKYVETRSSEDVQVWQGYPWGLFVYAFLVPTFQLHAFSLYFSHNLAAAWKTRNVKKAQ